MLIVKKSAVLLWQTKSVSLMLPEDVSKIIKKERRGGRAFRNG